MYQPKYKYLLQGGVFFALSLCVSTSVLVAEDFLSDEELYGDFEDKAVAVSDPFESVNRVTFKLNDFFYMNVVKHIANGYQKVTPDPVERGASNFFKNLRYPVRLVGNLLQGRVSGAWVETERFAVNTTLGVVGIWPAADRFERMQALAPEDVGQAFGAWGIGEGPYLVLPLFGPSNARDLVGWVGDRAVSPLKRPYYVIDDSDVRWAFWLTGFTARSPQLLNIYEQMKGGAIDPYSAMKHGYTQTRRIVVEE